MKRIKASVILAVFFSLTVSGYALASEDLKLEDEIITSELQELKGTGFTFDWSGVHFIPNDSLTERFLNNSGTFIDVVNDDGSKTGYVIIDKKNVITTFVDFCGLDYELTEEMFEIDRDMLEIRNTEATDNDDYDKNLSSEEKDGDESLLRSNEYGNFGEHIIAGVSHNLQGSSNCIAAAAANVIWYHGNHGFPYIIGTNPWSVVRGTMHAAYDMTGSFANNNTASAINNYFALSGLSPATITVNVTWNTSSSYMRNEIDHSRPCMLGFVAGTNSYSGNHMTMCYGYKGINYTLYSVLADGHQSVPVYKLWDTAYNDCTIRISVS